MDEKPKLVVTLSDRDLGDEFDPAAARLRAGGFEVEVWTGFRKALDPTQLLEWMIELVLAKELTDRWPQIKQYLKEWFIELPEQKKKDTRVIVTDPDDNEVGQARFPDDLESS